MFEFHDSEELPDRYIGDCSDNLLIERCRIIDNEKEYTYFIGYVDRTHDNCIWYTTSNNSDDKLDSKNVSRWAYLTEVLQDEYRRYTSND